MAIEIVPKPKQRIKVEISFFDILYYFAVSLVIVSISFYLSLYLFEQKLETRLEELNTLIMEKESKEIKGLEENIINLKERVDTVGSLLASRQKTTSFFQLISSLTHPKLYFSTVELDTRGLEVKLSGFAQDFAVLKEQIFIFENEELIKDVTLSKASVANDGGVEFSITLSVEPEVFK